MTAVMFSDREREALIERAANLQRSARTDADRRMWGRILRKLFRAQPPVRITESRASTLPPQP